MSTGRRPRCGSQGHMSIGQRRHSPPDMIAGVTGIRLTSGPCLVPILPEAFGRRWTLRSEGLSLVLLALEARRLLRSFIVATGFGAVATDHHIAPATAMVFAGIDKQPATALFICALTYPFNVFRSQEIYGREGQDPERRFQGVFVEIPSPFEFSRAIHNLRAVCQAGQGGI